MSEATKKNKYNAPALDKGLDIIELLSLHADRLSQGDIARALNRSQSEIYRMLTTLVQRGYIERSADNDLYALTLKMFALSQRHPPVQRLLEVAGPKVRKLTRKAWQSCHMGMESNGDIVVVASVESPGNWSLALRVGTVIGLGNTGTGRVLAAFRSDDDIDDLLDRHRLAIGEPAIDRVQFLEHVARIRETGYERMPSATLVGVTNLVYPVFDRLGRAITVVNCPYLERIDQLDVPDIDQVHEMYQALAKELTAFYCGTSSQETTQHPGGVIDV